MELADALQIIATGSFGLSLYSRGVVYGLLIVMNKYPTLGCRVPSPLGLNTSLGATPGLVWIWGWELGTFGNPLRSTQ